MAKQTVIVSDFSGGKSEFEKTWNTGSGLEIKRLNIREDPNYITMLPRATDTATVNDLPKWMVDGGPWSTDRFAYGSTGYLYKETANVWSVLRIVPNSRGQGLYVFDDALFYATNTSIGRYGKLDDSPTFDDNWFVTNDLNIDKSQATSGQTYTLKSVISEALTDTLSFVSRNDPITDISVLVASKGTGDWVLTLHDTANNTLGTVTILNANITNSAYNKFTFTTPVKAVPNNTYHFHITQSTADGTVTTGVVSDFSTVAYKEYFGVLLSDDDFHPMIDIGTGLVIGNGNYLAVYDEITYNANQLILPSGFKVRCLSFDGEYIVAGCYKGQSIDTAEDARLFYWDGVTALFNYFKPCSHGAPMCLTNNNNTLLGIYGNRTALYIGSDPFQSVQEVCRLARGTKMEVYPGACAAYNSLSYFGLGFSTTDTTAVEGIYSYGNQNDRLPNVVDYSFTPVNGSETGATLQIGFVAGFGTELYWGYYNGSGYYIDRVSIDSSPALTGSWYSLLYDNANAHKMKMGLKLILKMNPLASGESVALKYIIDRGTEVVSAPDSTTGDVRYEFVISKPFYNIKFGFNLATTTTFPIVESIMLEFDDLVAERPER